MQLLDRHARFPEHRHFSQAFICFVSVKYVIMLKIWRIILKRCVFFNNQQVLDLLHVWDTDCRLNYGRHILNWLHCNVYWVRQQALRYVKSAKSDVLVVCSLFRYASYCAMTGLEILLCVVVHRWPICQVRWPQQLIVLSVPVWSYKQNNFLNWPSVAHNKLAFYEDLCYYAIL